MIYADCEENIPEYRFEYILCNGFFFHIHLFGAMPMNTVYYVHTEIDFVIKLNLSSVCVVFRGVSHSACER